MKLAPRYELERMSMVPANRSIFNLGFVNELKVNLPSINCSLTSSFSIWTQPPPFRLNSEEGI